jgi:RNA polymerase sigma factor (sigma-70 family)
MKAGGFLGTPSSEAALQTDPAREFRATQAAGEGFTRAELPAALADALADLPSKQYEAARRVWLEGKTEAATAAELGITQSAVNQRLKSARRRAAGLLAYLQTLRLSRPSY